MSFRDLLVMVWENLGRMKARVAMTANGVLIGTTAAVVLVSLATGLQRSVTSELGSIGELKDSYHNTLISRPIYSLGFFLRFPAIWLLGVLTGAGLNLE